MRVRVLRNLGRGLPDYREGQAVTVSEAEGKRLLSAGVVEIIEATPAKPTVKAVPTRTTAKPEVKPQPKTTTADSATKKEQVDG